MTTCDTAVTDQVPFTPPRGPDVHGRLGSGDTSRQGGPQHEVGIRRVGSQQQLSFSCFEAQKKHDLEGLSFLQYLSPQSAPDSSETREVMRLVILLAQCALWMERRCQASNQEGRLME